MTAVNATTSHRKTATDRHTSLMERYNTPMAHRLWQWCCSLGEPPGGCGAGRGWRGRKSELRMKRPWRTLSPSILHTTARQDSTQKLSCDARPRPAGREMCCQQGFQARAGWGVRPP